MPKNVQYSSSEMMNLVRTIEKVLPIHQDDWAIIKVQHDVFYGHLERTTDSFKRKCRSLHRQKIPTGNPAMPDEVRVAKRAYFKIGQKADIGDGREGFDPITGDFFARGQSAQLIQYY